MIKYANNNNIQIRGEFIEIYNDDKTDIYVEAYDLTKDNEDALIHMKKIEEKFKTTEPTYDSSNRSRRKISDECIDLIKMCLIENKQKRATGKSKQQLKATDIYELLINKGYDISYPSVSNIVRSLKDTLNEAYIKQEYSLGNICEFDWGEVKLNIGYVSISLNTGSLPNLSAAEYRLNKNSLYLNIEVKSISDDFQENLTDLNTNDLLELLNISIKNTTTDTVLSASDYNLVNSSQLYHYINLNEDVIMPAVYKVIVQNLNPNSSIITEQNMSFKLSAVSLELENDYLNNVVIQPDGSITAQFYLYARGGTSYPTNVFESNTLTAQLLETGESGQSTVELNDINVSHEIKSDNEIQKTAIIITAKLSTVSDSYYRAVLRIQASSDNLDYNDIDTEISFAISKYNLTDNDYIKGTDGTIYNGKEGTYKLSYDLSEGESFKFSEIFDMSTVNNMYGSWKLQQRQADGTYEDINFDTAITKSNLSFRLVFVPKFEDYCEIPNDIDIILELNINTNV